MRFLELELFTLVTSHVLIHQRSWVDPGRYDGVFGLLSRACWIKNAFSGGF
jgi:hypothetical protein